MQLIPQQNFTGTTHCILTSPSMLVQTTCIHCFIYTLHTLPTEIVLKPELCDEALPLLKDVRQTIRAMFNLDGSVISSVSLYINFLLALTSQTDKPICFENPLSSFSFDVLIDILMDAGKCAFQSRTFLSCEKNKGPGTPALVNESFHNMKCLKLFITKDGIEYYELNLS